MALTGVGVWAATSQAATVTSTVKFVATGVDAKIDLTVNASTVLPSGTKLTSADSPVVGTLFEVADFDLEDGNSSATTKALSYSFTETDSEKGIIAANTTFTYTFVITNQNTDKDLYFKVDLTTNANTYISAEVTANDKVDGSKTEDTTSHTPGGIVNTAEEYGKIASGTSATTATFTVTYTFNAPATPTVELYNSVCNKSITEDSLTADQQAEYYAKLNYSTALGGYYKIAADTQIADVAISLQTTGTYVPAVTTLAN